MQRLLNTSKCKKKNAFPSFYLTASGERENTRQIYQCTKASKQLEVICDIIGAYDRWKFPKSTPAKLKIESIKFTKPILLLVAFSILTN